MPRDWKAEQFAAWPPVARQTAIEHLATLNQLPASFAPFLLKEISFFDWKFPAEREEMLGQLRYLESLSAADREREMAPFAALKLSPELLSFDAINKPGEFLEKLSAHLWATGQMDAFRSASEQYMVHFRQAHPEPEPEIPRFAIVLIGQGVSSSNYPLFRKLRRQGTLFRKLDTAPFAPLEHIVATLKARADAHPAPYAHWWIDGAEAAAVSGRITPISYQALSSVRLALATKIRKAFESRMSPEALRTMLAETTPESLGAHASGDPLLDRFTVSLFTEGSGTQIYSTTFVQWATREVLRRAQPLTVVARYAPRAREASMHDLLSGNPNLGTDPVGSLIDADMGAWYTWIGLQRLKGSEKSNLLAWFEEHGQAVAVGPEFARGKDESARLSIADLLQRMAA